MDKQELWDFVKSDTRSPTEIFEELRQSLQTMSGNKLSEKESIEAVRNLIGFCETIVGLGKKHRRLDMPDTTSNMEDVN